MTKLTKEQIIEKLDSLIISCKSAKKEEWDLYYDGNWDAMIEHLKDIKEFIK